MPEERVCVLCGNPISEGGESDGEGCCHFYAPALGVRGGIAFLVRIERASHPKRATCGACVRRLALKIRGYIRDASEREGNDG